VGRRATSSRNPGHGPARRGGGGERAYLATGVGGGEAERAAGRSGGAADELRASSRIAASCSGEGDGRVGSGQGGGSARSRAGQAMQARCLVVGRDANAMANTECESANVTMQSW
jgi:hypothetical protein